MFQGNHVAGSTYIDEPEGEPFETKPERCTACNEDETEQSPLVPLGISFYGFHPTDRVCTICKDHYTEESLINQTE